MKIIAFTGAMGVGKSTAIAALKEFANRQVVNIKFAEPLYNMQEMIYERIQSVYKRPDSFIKDRKLLQWLGTDWGRDTISKSLWVDLWRAEVKLLSEYAPGTIVTCDDVRFDNEAEMVKSAGGVIIKLTSDKNVVRIDTKTGIANHASEAGVSTKYLDFMVANDGTVEDFKSSLYPIFKAVLSNGNND